LSTPDSQDLAVHDPEEIARQSARIARRIHRIRALGLGLGSICVASVLLLNGNGPGWWLWLIAHAYVWPQFALRRTLRSDKPRRTEAQNLLLDSALGGVWVAVMQCNLLPSVLLVTMLTVDKVDTHRRRALVRSTLLLAATFAVTWTLLGWPMHVESPMSVVIACLPLLVVYPLATSAVSNALARRVTEQNRKLEELGRTDVLTGLANRRLAFGVAEAEFARYRRSAHPSTLLILDIDNFKGINDRHGHPVGDEALCGLAAILRDEVRVVDTAARYGGDEFMIVMPETRIAGAQELARRIRLRLAGMALASAPDLRCTASIGAAEASRTLTDVDAWINHADKALYRAKALGRDRFVAANDEASVTASAAAR
jgi:diguanylate cyclase